MTGEPEHRVLVTRPPGSWPRLVTRLARAGVAVDLHATTRATEPQDAGPGERAIDRLGTYDWLVVTSRRGAAALTARLSARGVERLPDGVRVAAVGPATARALQDWGARVDVVADEARGESLARDLARRLESRESVLIVRPEDRSDSLAELVRGSAGRVDEAPLYRTVASEQAQELADAAIGGRWVAIVFTAPSSLDLWVAGAAPRSSELLRALHGVARVAIGPTTAAHLDAVGLPAAAVAAAPIEQAVGDALERALGIS